MTFLELCNRVASDSATASGETSLSTVVGNTGRLAKIVRWTNDAWRQLQNLRSDWRWMQSEFTGTINTPTQRYSYGSFNDALTLTPITRFKQWVCRGDRTEDRFSIYQTAEGVAGEGRLRFISWDDFYRTQLRGTPPTQTKPQYFSISPQQQLVFSPIPDQAHVVRGPYTKSAQDLTSGATPDTNVPEMPLDFHPIIVDWALIMLGIHDEAPVQIPLWRINKIAGISDLMQSQLPQITWGGALA